jgi:antibiotic biosynthesis monooxygenase (ABM) superfamily enzyme
MKNQVIHEQTNEQRLIEKATAIAEAHRVRKTSNHNIWIVGSGNPKTPSKWSSIIWDAETQLFCCSCPAFTYCPVGNTDQFYCCHLFATAMFEGEEVR